MKVVTNLAIFYVYFNLCAHFESYILFCWHFVTFYQLENSLFAVGMIGIQMISIWALDICTWIQLAAFFKKLQNKTFVTCLKIG